MTTDIIIDRLVIAYLITIFLIIICYIGSHFAVIYDEQMYIIICIILICILLIIGIVLNHFLYKNLMKHRI